MSTHELIAGILILLIIATGAGTVIGFWALIRVIRMDGRDTANERRVAAAYEDLTPELPEHLGDTDWQALGPVHASCFDRFYAPDPGASSPCAECAPVLEDWAYNRREATA